MSWSDEYRSKRMSAAEALEAVVSGERVWIQSGCGTPSVLVEAMVARAPRDIFGIAVCFWARMCARPWRTDGPITRLFS